MKAIAHTRCAVAGAWYSCFPAVAYTTAFLLLLTAAFLLLLTQLLSRCC